MCGPCTQRDHRSINAWRGGVGKDPIVPKDSMRVVTAPEYYLILKNFLIGSELVPERRIGH